MNKSAGVLLGIAVAIGSISAGGAWYTGSNIEGALNTAIADANIELNAALVGSNGTASLELVSFERHVFSSTAHYRLKGEGEMFGEAPVEVRFADHIEHGPLPFSRLVSFKWLPVMAASHFELERTSLTEKWFVAAKDQSPLTGVINIEYDKSASGTLELLPLDVVLNDKSSLKFSGLNLDITVSPLVQKLQAKLYMDSLILSTGPENQPPVKVELKGLTIAGNRVKGTYGFYTGDDILELAGSQTTYGAKQSVLGIKKIELKNHSEQSGTTASVRSDYKVGDVSLNGKTIGSAQMAISLKNFDIPAILSLTQFYQAKLQAASTEVAGEFSPDLALTPAEEVSIKTALENLLAAGPQVALDNLSLNTTNGESHASLVLGLTKPQSLDLPADQLALQLIALLDINVQVSKPMLVDLLSTQSQLDGQTDANRIADQATATADMFSSMAVGTQFAKLDGNNVVSKLHYANNQVEFNGQKMTAEEFADSMMSKLGGRDDD
ncbi:YdgA family protein [Pseudomonas fluorescens]|uniref:Protein YdgA n=1 Tax=Pseudomonas fluorescens TaxID=294 RepID=A0A5E7PY91_PSEFL|nr:YdgA family protein [Pseudomonas fluorescens]VVP54635.1 Protein YdgA [Pseudomonas fluorescens]